MKIRVFLAGGMRGLLHDIVRDTLAEQPDMELVGDASNGDELSSMLRTDQVDFVIVGSRRPEDFAVVSPMLLASPCINVLAIATNGRSGRIYRLQPIHVSLGEMSPQELVTAVRTEAGSHADWCDTR